jgi:hypothetical protein
MSSASSLRRWGSCGPVESNPAGDGQGGAVARPKRRSCKTRAVASQPSSAALPPSESRPSCSDRRGPRCARLAPGAPQPGAAGPVLRPSRAAPGNWGSVFIFFQPWFAHVICVCWSSDMARSIRLELEGAFYHVMARGNRRAAIFVDDQDR